MIGELNKDMKKFSEWFKERTRHLTENFGGWEEDAWEINGVFYSFHVVVNNAQYDRGDSDVGIRPGWGDFDIELEEMLRWDHNGRGTPVAKGTPEYDKVKDDYMNRAEEKIRDQFHGKAADHFDDPDRGR